MLEVDKTTFEAEVLQAPGKVVVDFYGDGCVPCAALMPHVHEFAEKYGATLKFCALNTTTARRLAISQKVPIVAMYGPSHPELYGPYTKQATIVRANPPCDGCRKGMKHHCDDMRCMRDLTVKQVLKAAHHWLKEKK